MEGLDVLSWPSAEVQPRAAERTDGAPDARASGSLTDHAGQCAAHARGRRLIPYTPQRHRNVPILYNDSPKADAILAFAECPLLANNGHRRTSLECPLSG